MLTADPDLPYLEFRARLAPSRRFWAKRMPADFSILVDKGIVDQRKAGAKAKVQYVQVLEGKAGDYLVIRDLGTGAKAVFEGASFEAAFEPVPEP